MSLWQQVTDVQRQRIVEKIVGALPESGIPEHLREGLVCYFADGILPGSFLQAVLANDLTQAVGRADPTSLRALPELLACLVQHAPAIAWGSAEAVLSWTTTPHRFEAWPRGVESEAALVEQRVHFRRPLTEDRREQFALLIRRLLELHAEQIDDIDRFVQALESGRGGQPSGRHGRQ
jgi:hypothetical protein